MKTISIIVLFLFVVVWCVAMLVLYLLSVNNYFNSAYHCKRKQIKSIIKELNNGIKQLSNRGHGCCGTSSYNIKQPEIKQYFLDRGFMIDESNCLIVWDKNYYECYYDRVETLLYKGKN